MKLTKIFVYLKKGEIIEQNINNEKSIGKFIYFDIVNKRVYFDKIFREFNIPSKSDKNNTKFNITGKESGFKINPKEDSIIVKDESYFINNAPPLKDASLFVDYVFLDNNVKTHFKNQKKTLLYYSNRTKCIR